MAQLSHSIQAFGGIGLHPELMIHIATVHWREPKWIAPQQQALLRNIHEPHRVYANLEGIESRAHDSAFYRVTRAGGRHPEKLNGLAALIANEAEAQDRLVFLDGDAFPIRPLDQWIQDLLCDHPLAAVRRIENAGDKQPHPSFCVTTVGFWRSIEGDWEKGPTWTNDWGKPVTDVGARLFAALSQRGTEWRPILRTNARDLHPLFFGIYGHHIYHHGAGFRPPMSRADRTRRTRQAMTAHRIVQAHARPGSLLKLRPRHIPTLLHAARRPSEARKIHLQAQALREQSDLLFQQVSSDPGFYTQFE